MSQSRGNWQSKQRFCNFVCHFLSFFTSISDLTGECAVVEVSPTPTTPDADSVPTSSLSQSPLKAGDAIAEEEETSASNSFSMESPPIVSPTTREPQFSPPVTTSKTADLLAEFNIFFFQSISAKPGYRWRIDLTKTEKHWPGWFHGLSDTFLSVPAAKLLLLAGIDRLDRDLTVGQMQGNLYRF